MAAERPILPFLLDTIEDFLENVNKKTIPWVNYLRKAHEYITTTLPALEYEKFDLLERLTIQSSEIMHLEEKNNTLKNEA